MEPLRINPYEEMLDRINNHEQRLSKLETAHAKECDHHWSIPTTGAEYQVCMKDGCNAEKFKDSPNSLVDKLANTNEDWTWEDLSELAEQHYLPLIEAARKEGYFAGSNDAHKAMNSVKDSPNTFAKKIDEAIKLCEPLIEAARKQGYSEGSLYSYESALTEVRKMEYGNGRRKAVEELKAKCKQLLIDYYGLVDGIQCDFMEELFGE